MDGFSRLLSKRGRSKAQRISRSKAITELHGLFVVSEALDGEVHIRIKNDKAKEIQYRLKQFGITSFEHDDVSTIFGSSWTEREFAQGTEVAVLLADTVEGAIRPYNPRTKMQGAINRNGVSCYLDSVLFAMFSYLDSFEVMICKPFINPLKNRLAFLLRLWLNTVRLGRLVQVDFTARIQDTLAQLGWPEAAKGRQQDASEAFSFITEQLELPMLTLKMDIFHTGTEDVNDDHKFVRERLLEVAIPEEPTDGSVVTLEDCLETYFNSRIEVRRYLERRATNRSLNHPPPTPDPEKARILHIESLELGDPEASTPTSPTTTAAPSNFAPVRPPMLQRARMPSIIQQSYVYEKDEKSDLANEVSSGRIGTLGSRPRASTLRKEVMMPAWQFYSLIPWYTDDTPDSDAQVAAHLASKRPVLGICLKRYSWGPDGQPQRRNTHIDIPVEIGLPHFIHDDTMDESAAAFGNFKLSLQSVVCHRGTSVNAGHYVSLVRGKSELGGDKWSMFDDMMPKRVNSIDIDQTLRDEKPYLLFYQVQPIDGSDSAGSPPSYSSDTRDSGVAGLSSTGSDAQVLSANASEGQRLSFDEAARNSFFLRGRSVDSRRGRDDSSRRLSFLSQFGSTPPSPYQPPTAVHGDEPPRSISLNPGSSNGNTVGSAYSNNHNNNSSNNNINSTKPPKMHRKSLTRPSSQASREGRLSIGSIGRITGKLALLGKQEPLVTIEGVPQDKAATRSMNTLGSTPSEVILDSGPTATVTAVTPPVEGQADRLRKGRADRDSVIRGSTRGEEAAAAITTRAKGRMKKGKKPERECIVM